MKKSKELIGELKDLMNGKPKETRVVTAPEDFNYVYGLFLAGGITGTGNWQLDMVDLLKKENLDSSITMVNPRRDNFDTSDSAVEREQITWEHRNLAFCSAVLFWFTPETLCPITLFELGKMSQCKGNLYVGCHPDYKRVRDVKIQMELARKDVTVVDSLEALAKLVADNEGRNPT